MEFPETIENMMLELLELYETESGKKFPIEGYNIDEIRYYENLYGFSFPKYYKDFLLKTLWIFSQISDEHSPPGME